MEERADTEIHFCIGCAGIQTMSKPSLYIGVRKPIKHLSHPASLATAGLYAACEPGCGYTQTNQALTVCSDALNSLGGLAALDAAPAAVPSIPTASVRTLMLFGCRAHVKLLGLHVRGVHRLSWHVHR